MIESMVNIILHKSGRAMEGKIAAFKINYSTDTSTSWKVT